MFHLVVGKLAPRGFGSFYDHIVDFSKKRYRRNGPMSHLEFYPISYTFGKWGSTSKLTMFGHVKEINDQSHFSQSHMKIGEFVELDTINHYFQFH